MKNKMKNKIEIKIHDNVKHITWTEQNKNIIDDVSYLDIHEIMIKDDKIVYNIFDIKGEMIKQIKN